MPVPLSALSLRNVAKPPLQRGEDYPEVLSVREIGGPEDPADRRLVVDLATLEQLCEVARTSLSQRVVIHGIGLRVQTLRDRQSGHRWDHVVLIGREPKPGYLALRGLIKED